jgi:hypothetical protein
VRRLPHAEGAADVARAVAAAVLATPDVVRPVDTEHSRMQSALREYV